MLDAIKLSRSTAAGLAAIGVSWGSLAAVVPDLKAQTDLDQAGLGIAFIFAALGGLVSMYFAPRFVPKIGPKVIPVLTVLVAATLLLPGHTTGLVSFAIPLFVMGLSFSMLDMAANMRIAETEAESGNPLMNFNHGVFSLVFAFAALLAGYLRSQGLSPNEIFTIAAVINLAFAWLSFEKVDHIVVTDDEQSQASSGPLPWVPILFTTVIFFAAFVGENAIEAWSALYLETELAAAVGEGSLGPFAFGLIMAIGRFGGQLAVSKLGPIRLVFYSGMLGAAGAMLLAFAPSAFVAIIAIGLTAFGMSTVVPNANTLLIKFARKGQRGLVLSRAWMIGFIGFFVGPSMIGFIAEASSLRVAFAVVALLIACIVPAVLGLERRLDRKASQ